VLPNGAPTNGRAPNHNTAAGLKTPEALRLVSGGKVISVFPRSGRLTHVDAGATTGITCSSSRRWIDIHTQALAQGHGKDRLHGGAAGCSLTRPTELTARLLISMAARCG